MHRGEQAPQPLGGILPRCCHGTRHQHSQRLTSSDTQCTSCRTKDYRLVGANSAKVFSLVLEPRSQKSRCQQGGPLWRP